jgi:hypothetical protein
MRITGFTVRTFLRTAGVGSGLGFGMWLPIQRKGASAESKRWLAVGTTPSVAQQFLNV